MFSSYFYLSCPLTFCPQKVAKLEHTDIRLVSLIYGSAHDLIEQRDFPHSCFRVKQSFSQRNHKALKKPSFKISTISSFIFAEKNDMGMIRLSLLLSLFCATILKGQETVHNLSHYIETAKVNSPLLRDYHNQISISKLN